MQINNSGVNNSTSPNSKSKPAESGTVSSAVSSESSKAPAPSDSVELSQEAQTLKRLEAQVVAAPNTDASKVADIKQAIADGRYTMNADNIADKIINSDGLF
ncbi:MAG: flagellar biosynthesis anti-sigma factor FlgM [Pseudomonadota bacterium]